VRKLISTRRRVVALSLMLTLAVAGTAFAYWTITGTGTGTAETGTIVDVVVNQTSDNDEDMMYPGGPVVELSGDFDNPNDGDVYIGSVTVEIDESFEYQGDDSKPACTPADYELGGTADVNGEIPSGDGVGSWSGLTIRMLNTEFNQDNCKNQTVPLIYTVVAP
jgi:hypothetical protein